MKYRSLVFVFLALVLMCGSASATIPTNYTYYFDFEEGTGTTANNANTSNNDMTLTGSELWTYPGGVYFNGTSTNIGTIADEAANQITGTASFTIYATFNGNGNSNAMVATKWNQWQLRVINNVPRFVLWDAVTSAETTYEGTSISASQNHTFVIRGNGTYVDFYVDGTLANSKAYPANGIKTSTNAVTSGSALSNYQETIVYDLAIYNGIAFDNLSVFGVGTSEEPTSDVGYATYDDDGYSGYAVLNIYDSPMTWGYLINNTYLPEDLVTPMDTSLLYIANATDGGWDVNATDYVRTYSGSIVWPDETIHFIPDAKDHTEFVCQSGFETGEWNFTNAMITGIPNIRAVDIRHTGNWTDSIFNSVGYIKIAERPADEQNTSWYMSNVTVNGFNDTGSPFFWFKKDMWITGGIIENIFFHNGTGGLIELSNAENMILRDIYLYGGSQDGSGTGVYIHGTDDTDGSQYYGVLDRGHDFELYNITLYQPGRSGIAFSWLAYNITLNDSYVYESGHNGIDVHGAWNVTMHNVSSVRSRLENFMITSPNSSFEDPYIHTREGYQDIRQGTTCTHDIYVYDLYVEDASMGGVGSDLSLNRFINAQFMNVTSYNSSKFANVNTAESLKLINCTATSMRGTAAITLGTGGTYGYMNDTQIVDCYFTSETTDPYMYLYKSFNTSIINSYADGGITYEAAIDNEWENYQYINARVINTTGYPVTNAILTANTTTRNGYGDIQTTFYTDESGYINMENRSNRMAILDYYRNNSGTIQYTSLITASKDGETDTAVFTPDGTYSANTSTGGQSGELITLTLDVPGEGEPIPLSITSFTPSDITPSSVNGTEQTFTATFSIESNASWYVDSVLQEWDNSTTLASYSNSTAPVGTYNVTVIGTVGDESVQQSWEWTVEESNNGGFVAVVGAFVLAVGYWWGRRRW